MAEVFSVIAGGLSVVSLAIQLSESIQKLRDFYESVKEFSNDIRLGLDEIGILSLVLQDIEQSIQDRGICCNGSGKL